MSEYRRFYQSGGYYFFTLVTHLRQPFLADPKNVNHLKAAMNKVKIKYPFSLHAIVILPDHLHCLWKLPEGDKDFSTRWRLIKRYFSMEMKTSINHRREKTVWQRRFWEHAIRDEDDWLKHINYIHYNPVKHKLAKSPGDWEYSSFNYWVEKGIYTKDWGTTEQIVISGMDEAE